MAKLIMCKGLSASGKTLWAQTVVGMSKGNVKMVEKDRLRDMLDNGTWSSSNEKLVIAIRDVIIAEALKRGQDIICSDTNLDPKHETRLRQLAQEYSAEFEIKDFTDVPLEECLKRDRKRPNYVGEKVILDQWKKYLAPKTPVRAYDPKLPDCVVCDIDGTLAIHNGRSPYDYEKCVEDLPNVTLIQHLEYLRESIKYGRPLLTLFLMSGRPEAYRKYTQIWLDANAVEYDVLYMRVNGDNRDDRIVKQEMFEQHVEGRYNVIAWFDDRPKVIRHLRALGLPVHDVAGSAEF